MRATVKCLALVALFYSPYWPAAPHRGRKESRALPPPPTAPTAAYPKIVLYTVSWCPHCKEAKEYLSSRNIPYTNLDVEKDESAMAVFAEKYQATSVPLIVIGNDEAVLKGFSRETLEKTLRKLKK